MPYRLSAQVSQAPEEGRPLQTGLWPAVRIVKVPAFIIPNVKIKAVREKLKSAIIVDWTESIVHHIWQQIT